MRALMAHELYGVVAKCNERCPHLLAANVDFFQAWADAEEFAGLEDIHTVIIEKNHPSVLRLQSKSKRL